MLMTEEPVGPIAPIVRFSDTDEAIRRANSLPFGLSSYVFTNSLQTATKAANDIEAGLVNINHFGSALPETDRKSTRLNSSHSCASRMPSSALQKKNTYTTNKQSTETKTAKLSDH